MILFLSSVAEKYMTVSKLNTDCIKTEQFNFFLFYNLLINKCYESGLIFSVINMETILGVIVFISATTGIAKNWKFKE